MTVHPLDPLTAEEIDRVRELLTSEHGVGADWRYASIEAVEPAKADLAAYANGGPLPPRRAEVICFQRRDGSTFRARVDLAAASVESFEPVPGVQPNFTIDEWEECDAMLRHHPSVLTALAARGITDLSAVFIDTWTYGGALVPDAYAGRRLGWSDVWVRRVAGGNPYAGPVNGLHFVVDVGAMELLEIEDTYAVPRPEIMGEYRPHLLPEALRGHRPPRAPLEVTQPDGPGFSVDGQEVSWQNWRLRVGFNHREGLTLHQVGYRDAGRERSVAHKLSFAEMMVPYRDPGVDHYRRTAFDIGEWGLGFLTQSLKLGCDCLGEIRYLDAVMHDSAGRPYTIPNAICLHEEDSAVGWKHVDHDGTAEVRRQRRFVVSFHVTVANYEYLTYWRFYEDGSIECEVRATGIMVVSHVPEGAAHPHGTLVDTRTYAPIHQHFVVARLDLDVDGTDNTVVRSETVTDPIGPANPYGLGVRQVKAPFVVEGPDDYAWETQRAWSVVNPGSLNAHGTPVGYKLVPGAAIPSFFDPASPVFRRAEVVGHTVWVTPHDPDQRWPAGEFVNQGGPGMGMPEWVSARRATDRTDVVLWYVFGIHHVPRPEDWPVMPVDTISFWLKPSGFFDRNPALDVEPHPAPHCHAPVTPPPTST
ncbi:primary-amine oxidase [Jiangella alba]|uniref:Amine oxidase n=1 Tax=Jiangella alba TaxID=561176 RepID=A0A1H5PFL6_9ACTN|nr:primary-amine oxidase [Jiangella alba]